MTNKLTIYEVENGYMLEWHEEDDAEAKIAVVEHNDGFGPSMEKLLTGVAERFGYEYDEFGLRNLHISFNKRGHKLS